METDEVAKAFAQWKAAQDEVLAAEQRLVEAAGTSRTSIKFSCSKDNPLALEVQAKRRIAEDLLQAAVKLLHDRCSRPSAL